MALAGMAALGWFGYKYFLTDSKPTPQQKARVVAQQNLARAQAAQAAQPKRSSAPVVSAPAPVISAAPKPLSGSPATSMAGDKAAEAREKFRNLPNRSSGVPSP